MRLSQVGAAFDGQNSKGQGGKLDWIVLIGDLWLISQIVKVWYVVSPPSDPVNCYWFIFWSIFKQFSFSRILVIRNIPSAGLGLNYLLWPLDQSKSCLQSRMEPTDSCVLCTISAIASNPCHALRAAFGRQPSLGAGGPAPHLWEPWGKEQGRGKFVVISFFLIAFFAWNNFFDDRLFASKSTYFKLSKWVIGFIRRNL